MYFNKEPKCGHCKRFPSLIQHTASRPTQHANRFTLLFTSWHGHKIYVVQDRQAREANTENSRESCQNDEGCQM